MRVYCRSQLGLPGLQLIELLTALSRQVDGQLLLHSNIIVHELVERDSLGELV